MDAKQLKKLSDILRSESNTEAVKKVKSIMTEDELFVLLDNYNWDNGFEVPTEILSNPHCTLSTALLAFYRADGYRYLFLLKSDYFDALDSDERGNIEIIDKTDFKKIAKAQGYIDEQIVLNDIQDGVNNKAREIYQEISIQNEHFQNG